MRHLQNCSLGIKQQSLINDKLYINNKSKLYLGNHIYNCLIISGVSWIFFHKSEVYIYFREKIIKIEM